MSNQPVPATPQPATPPWRGINHLALVTDDMDATVRFYHGTLGARLVATIGTAHFKHYFFEFGPECTVAFFEYADHKHERLAKPATETESEPPPGRSGFRVRGRVHRGVHRSPMVPEGISTS